jgi:hypothetical protein
MFLGSKVRPARKVDSFTAMCEPTVYTMWDPQHLTPPRPVTGIASLFFLLFYLVCDTCLKCKLRRKLKPLVRCGKGT